MQFDSEICTIYTLQMSQTRLASPRHEARRAKGPELARATRRANRFRVLNEVSESGFRFTRLAPNSPRLASSRLVAISTRSLLDLNFKCYSDCESDAAILSINSMPVSVEYADYAHVFEERKIPQLPLHRPGVDHKITLAPDSKSFYGSIYNLSETKLCCLKEYIARMLARRFIHPSKSPFGSLILFVKKANGRFHLVIDY